MLTESTTVVCAECGQSNSAGALLCSRCECHLYVHCRHCGHLNSRGTFQCADCRTPLFRKATPTHMLYWPMRWRNDWTTGVQLALLVFTAAAGLAWAVFGARFLDQLTKPKETPVIILVQPESNR